MFDNILKVHPTINKSPVPMRKLKLKAPTATNPMMGFPSRRSTFHLPKALVLTTLATSHTGLKLASGADNGFSDVCDRRNRSPCFTCRTVLPDAITF